MKSTKTNFKLKRNNKIRIVAIDKEAGENSLLENRRTKSRITIECKKLQKMKSTKMLINPLCEKTKSRKNLSKILPNNTSKPKLKSGIPMQIDEDEITSKKLSKLSKEATNKRAVNTNKSNSNSSEPPTWSSLLKMKIKKEENLVSRKEQEKNQELTNEKCYSFKLNDPSNISGEVSMELNDYLMLKNKEKYFPQYSANLLRTLKRYEESSRIPEKFLDRHYLQSEMRAKMIDWMIEVMSVYSQNKRTFFLAVKIMDKFLTNVNGVIYNDDIHLIGICSIYIAIKFEEVAFVPLDSIVSNIGHNLFEGSIIKKKEAEIIKTISYDLIYTTPYDFFELFLQDFEFNCKEFLKENTEMFKIYEKLLTIICKFMLSLPIFLKLKDSLIACISIVYCTELLKVNFPSFDQAKVEFLQEWGIYMSLLSGFPLEYLKQIIFSLNNEFGNYEYIISNGYDITRTHLIQEIENELKVDHLNNIRI